MGVSNARAFQKQSSLDKNYRFIYPRRASFCRIEKELEQCYVFVATELLKRCVGVGDKRERYICLHEQ